MAEGTVYQRIEVMRRARGDEVRAMVVLDDLWRAGMLTSDESDRYVEIDRWLHDNLKNSNFCADGMPTNTVTWFKTPTSDTLQAMAEDLCSILGNHGVPCAIVKSTDPGTIVYDDDFQISVVPYSPQFPSALDCPPRGSTSVKHVLFDADGVLQTVPGGWHAAMEPYVGDRVNEFLRQTWHDELTALAGRSDFVADLTARLADFGVTTPAEEVYGQACSQIVIAPDSFRVVESVRAAGYGVHLGTNQENHRADFMRHTLGYDDFFDVSCYSYELGVIKPDPVFFLKCASEIGADPASILFVDDNLANVEGARAAGLPALHWAVDHGVDELVSLLTEHGVTSH